MLRKQYNSLVSVGKGSIKNLLAGDKVLSEQELINQRRKICLVCPKWDASGFFGIGKCNVCGCSGYKLNIKASTCPEMKW